MRPITDVGENTLTYFFGDVGGIALDMYLCFENITIFDTSCMLV